MKKVALFAIEEEACENYKSQLENFFEGSIVIEAYSLKTIKSVVVADLYVLSFPDILESFGKYIPKGANIIYIYRTFLKSRVDCLSEIQNKKAILLDYSKLIAAETIGIIREIGFSNIDFKILTDTSEINVIDNLPIITTGVKRFEDPLLDSSVINLGYYMINVTTFADIAQRLDIMDEVMNRKLYQYSKIVAITNSGIVDSLKHAWNIHKEYETILDCIEEGVLVCNEEGNILHKNSFFEKILNIRKEITNIEDLPKNILYYVKDNEQFSNSLISINKDASILISKYKISMYNEHTAYIVIAKDVSNIQELEYEIRSKQAKNTFFAKYTFDDIITYDDDMKNDIEIAKKLAKTDISILLTGESGTGKELFAQAIHNCSERRGMPFVAINCAALPKDLLESELFGYEEGAFTGAKKSGKRGIFELGQGGTVFLDEIGDMPLPIQVKLLRVLQEKEVMRLGSEDLIKVDTRIIAATNSDIEELVSNDKFRVDLYYRLNVAQINIPPLRERKSDIIPLINYFFRKYSNNYNWCSENLKRKLINMKWPGNIRELENVAQYLVNVSERELQVADLPIKYRKDLSQKDKDKEVDVTDVPNDCRTMIIDMYHNHKLGRRKIREKLKDKGIYVSEYMIRKIIKEIGEQ